MDQWRDFEDAVKGQVPEEMLDDVSLDPKIILVDSTI
jgi:hypothetical protein